MSHVVHNTTALKSSEKRGTHHPFKLGRGKSNKTLSVNQERSVDEKRKKGRMNHNDSFLSPFTPHLL